MVGDAPVPGWLATDGLLAQFGRRRSEARRRYGKFVTEGGASIWSGLRQQIYLGDETFVEKMQKKSLVTGRSVEYPKGPAQKARATAGGNSRRERGVQ
jgi:hypothetical protein